MFSKTIFLEDIQVLREEDERILNEEFSYESFLTWATRKLKGYSVKEIDHLAKRVVNIDTHEEKTDVIERIRDAIKEGKEKLEKKKQDLEEDKESISLKNEVKYMQEHLSILNVLLSKAQSFNLVQHLENKKNQSQPNGENKDNTFVINDRT